MSTVARRGPPPRASARRIPPLAAAGGWLLTVAARALERSRRAVVLGRVGRRGRRALAGQGSLAGRRPGGAPGGGGDGARPGRSAHRGVAVTATAAELAAALDASRARFLAILEPFDEAVLRRQHDVLMSPLLWDLAHVANYEDIWLVRALGGEPTRAGLDDLYDAFKQPRNVREALPLLDLGGARAYGDAVRARALERLDEADLAPDAATRLTRDGLRAPHGRPARAPARRDAPRRDPAPAPRGGPRPRREPTPPVAQVAPPAEVLVPGGAFRMGSADAGRARQRTSGARGRRAAVLDRRRPRHQRPAPTLRGGRRLRRAALVDRRGLEVAAGGRPRRAAVLATGWRAAGLGCVRHRRAAARRRARAARRLVRGRRLRTVGRPAAPHRGGVGEGGRVRPRHRRAAAGGRGATRPRPSDTPTSASATSAPRRSARTRRA